MQFFISRMNNFTINTEKIYILASHYHLGAVSLNSRFVGIHVSIKLNEWLQFLLDSFRFVCVLM